MAEVELESGYGMSPVSLEQVLAWDPQVILVASDPAEESNVYEQITTQANGPRSRRSRTIRSIRYREARSTGSTVPRRISRILGVRWLGNLLYPDLYKYDMKAEVKQFYKLFYQMDLTDEQCRP